MASDDNAILSGFSEAFWRDLFAGGPGWSVRRVHLRPPHRACSPARVERLELQGADPAVPSSVVAAVDRRNAVTFAPMQTTASRIEVQLQPGWPAGVCDWEVG